MTDFEFRIDKVYVKNFRGIKQTKIAFKQNTIIVGRNNVGKSTIISALFGLQSSEFNVVDLNIDLIKCIYDNKTNTEWLKQNIDDLTVEIELEYFWKNVPPYLFELITSLSNTGRVKVRVIAKLNEDRLEELASLNNVTTLNEFFIRRYEIFDESINKWILADNHNRDLLFPKFGNTSKAALNIFHIKADRKFNSGKNSNDDLTGQLFNSRLTETVTKSTFIEAFNSAGKTLKDTIQSDLDGIKNDLGQFSFPNDTIESFDIIPTFDEWSKNPKVRVSQFYEELGLEIPINKQGLGYQNVYNILGQLGNAFSDIAKLSEIESGKTRRAVMFVIEEPEVYTHPQMQHVFVQQLVDHIKKKNDSNLYIQTVIISHSAEVAVAAIEKDNDYQLVRVATDENGNTISADWSSTEFEKSRLSSLILNYNAELLFADKVILVEGDSERILITAIMRRLQEEEHIDLLSKQVVIIPVGKSISRLEQSLQKLEFEKTVMFTDLDFKNADNEKEFDFKNAISSTNSTIKNVFLKDDNFQHVFSSNNNFFSTQYPSTIKNFHVFTQNWIENDFLPMTLEPSILNTGKNYNVLKNFFSKTVQSKNNNINLKSAVTKVDFAFEVADLILEKDADLNYKIEIPKYLKEGLKWLSK